MLNIVILDQEGETYGLAARLAQKGHIVKLWSEQPQETAHKPVFGPRQIDQYEPHIEAADLLVSNNPRTGGVAEMVRAGGRMALGGRVQEQLLTPQWQEQIASMLGIDLTQETPNYGIYGLWDGKNWKGRFWMQYLNRMLDDERGPITTGMGVLAKSIEDHLAPLLDDFLKGLQLPGFFGLRLYVDKQGVRLCSFEPFISSLEWAAIAEIVREDESELIQSMVTPSSKVTFLPSMLGGALRMAYISPEDAELVHTPEAWKHLWPEHQDGLLGVGAARGYTPKELRSRIFRTVESLTTQGTIYRKDLGSRMEEFNGYYSQASHH